MASDDAYASFLDKANQSTQPAASASSSSKKDRGAQAVHAGVSVPKSLTSGLDGVYYVSEADEEFEEVGLRWDGGDSLDDNSFSSLISTSTSKISIISTHDFDPRSQYTRVIDNVKKATKTGTEKIFRVEEGGARVGYWIVGLSKDGNSVVGLKVRSVES